MSKPKRPDAEYRTRTSDDGRWVLERKRPGEREFRVLHRDRAQSRAAAEHESKVWLELRREGDAIR